VSFDGVSQGVFILTSSNPLVADPGAPGQPANPTGDHFLYGSYDFPLSQPSAVVFATAILNPYATWTTLTVNSVQGQPVPFAFEFTLPSPYTSSMIVFSNNLNRVVYQPAFYNTSNIDYSNYMNQVGQTIESLPGGESVTFTRQSDGAIKYKGAAVFYDPVMTSQPVNFNFSGEVSLTNVGGGVWSISDSNSFLLTTPVDVIGALSDYFIVGKSSETGLYSGPIPEPGTYALMICGVGAVGAALRRRTRRLRLV
jgi:hypothetical protein